MYSSHIQHSKQHILRIPPLEIQSYAFTARTINHFQINSNLQMFRRATDPRPLDWYALGEALAEAERTNLILRGRCKEFSKSKDHSEQHSHQTTAVDTLNYLSSGNAGLRSEIILLLEKQRKIMGERFEIDPVDLDDAVSSIVRCSPIHNGATAPLSTLDHLVASDLDRLYHQSETLLGSTEESERIPEALRVSSELMEDVQDGLCSPSFLELCSETNQSGSFADALENLNFSAGVPEGFRYAFDEEDNSENISLRAGKVFSATLDKLVERLTEESSDVSFRYVFMLTYRSFSSGTQLLSLLETRFWVPLPPNMVPSECGRFLEATVAPVQIKVIGVLKFWIAEHFLDFSEDKALLSQLKVFIEEMARKGAGRWAVKSAQYLQGLVKRKENGEEKPLIADDRLAESLIKPEISYRAFEKNFMEQSEEEIARQMCLMDFNIFREMRPRECLNQNWNKRKHLAPNLVKIIENFNKASCWVQIEILSMPQLGKRVQMVKKFLKIAQHLRKLNNFNSLYAIYCGLHSISIHRLKKTWSQLPKKYAAIMDMMKELFSLDHKFQVFRQVLKQSVTPCIPHIGIYLSDLTLIEEGNDDFVENRINFSKCRMLAKSIIWIQQYQQVAYPFREIPSVQLYLQRNMENIDSEELWRMSEDLEKKR